MLNTLYDKLFNLFIKFKTILESLTLDKLLKVLIILLIISVLLQLASKLMSFIAKNTFELSKILIKVVAVLLLIVGVAYFLSHTERECTLFEEFLDFQKLCTPFGAPIPPVKTEEPATSMPAQEATSPKPDDKLLEPKGE